ncbi:helix-turn-helix transcriptional regulator [Streptomyces sp. MA5143a]|uniref:helix-turn-helix transcriptional regulator n=1 Tax=Streptomyces sp. MA5143a TaxID=2083010 RepID=UPI002158D684|nr:helix-turn-helix transcriptional regulator [Streptomyces sp. MA5143a]
MNQLTGDYTLSATDATAFEASVDRTFSSRANDTDTEGQAEIFGPGWASSITGGPSNYTQLRETSDASVEVLSADGSAIAFTETSSDGWEPEIGAESLSLTYSTHAGRQVDAHSAGVAVRQSGPRLIEMAREDQHAGNELHLLRTGRSPVQERTDRHRSGRRQQIGAGHEQSLLPWYRSQCTRYLSPRRLDLASAGACINVYGYPACSKTSDTWRRPLDCVGKEPTSANGLGHQVEEAGASEFHTHLDGPGPAMPEGADRTEIARALLAVASASAVYGEAVAGHISAFFTQPGRRYAALVFPELIDREREILEFVAEGDCNHAIARRLFLAEKTVRNHVSAITNRLGTASRAAVVARARERE